MKENDMPKYTVEDFGAPDYLDGARAQYAVRDETGDTKAFVYELADVNLFAAAPEMLEILCVLREAVERGDENLNPIMCAVDDVLKKIGG